MAYETRTSLKCSDVYLPRHPFRDGDARSFGFLTDSHGRDFYCMLKCSDDGETGGAQFCNRARFRRSSSSSWRSSRTSRHYIRCDTNTPSLCTSRHSYHVRPGTRHTMYIATPSYNIHRDADIHRTQQHAPTTYIVTHPVCRNAVIPCTPRHRHTSYIATHSYHIRRDTDIPCTS